jgi:hypothetical protein
VDSGKDQASSRDGEARMWVVMAVTGDAANYCLAVFIRVPIALAVSVKFTSQLYSL